MGRFDYSKGLKQKLLLEIEIFNTGQNEVFYKTENKALSPFQGEDISCWPTGGYASLTPGYFLASPSSFQVTAARARLQFNDPERVKDSSRAVRLRTPGNGYSQILHPEGVTEFVNKKSRCMIP